MARQTGADHVIAIKTADVWGTAESVGADDRCEVEGIEENRNPEELSANPIGSGRIAANDAQQGATTPTITLDKIMNYNDAGGALMAAFYGGESVVAQASGTAGYAHSFIQNETFGSRFVTYGRQYALNSVVEAATAAVTRLTYTAENPPNYVRMSAELLANDLLYEGTTNSFATLENSVTLSDTERVVATGAHEFLINGQTSSALASPTDRLSITSLVFEENKPMESAREFRGSAGNGEPIPSGDPPYEGTLTVTLKSVDEVTFFQRARDGIEFKASYKVTGTTIGAGVPKTFALYFPRLKLIEEPSSPVSSAGLNPLTLTFKVLVAASVPSGMADRYPHPVLINTKSTTWHSDV